MPITSMRALGIGALARSVGVTVETVRYYERIGLMPEPVRTTAGTRRYDQGHARRLVFIRRSRELGFSLDVIRSLLEMVDRENVTCGEVSKIAETHLAEIRDKIAQLRQLEIALGEIAEQCGRGDLPDCPIIDRLSDEAQPMPPGHGGVAAPGSGRKGRST